MDAYNVSRKKANKLLHKNAEAQIKKEAKPLPKLPSKNTKEMRNKVEATKQRMI